jgi:hypothetical protein
VSPFVQNISSFPCFTESATREPSGRSRIDSILTGLLNISDSQGIQKVKFSPSKEILAPESSVIVGSLIRSSLGVSITESAGAIIVPVSIVIAIVLFGRVSSIVIPDATKSSLTSPDESRLTSNSLLYHKVFSISRSSQLYHRKVEFTDHDD